MREGLKEVIRENMSVPKQLRILGNKFVNASEISAQESVYTLLGQHMSESSNAHVFINTYPPAKRVRLLKSRTELQSLAQTSPDSNDIYIADTYHHYVNRPDELDNICLADFVALYEFSRRYPSHKKVIENCSDSEVSNDEDDVVDEIDNNSHSDSDR